MLREAEQLYDEMKPDSSIRNRALFAVLGVENAPPGAQIPESYLMFNVLCWFRFGKTAAQLVQEYESGDVKAIRQFHKLNLEYDMWQVGKVDPRKLKFKANVDHLYLMAAGLDLGLETLSPDELADCFGALCPCEQTHDPESLGKLRTWILKQFPPISLVTDSPK